MERPPLFIWLWLGIAPAMAFLLLWRGGSRAFRESHRRKRIVALTLAALALSMVATYLVGLMGFGTVWGIAHTRPLPDGFFPEGWPIYGYVAAYSAFGATLVWVVGNLPRKRTTE